MSVWHWSNADGAEYSATVNHILPIPSGYAVICLRISTSQQDGAVPVEHVNDPDESRSSVISVTTEDQNVGGRFRFDSVPQPSVSGQLVNSSRAMTFGDTIPQQGGTGSHRAYYVAVFHTYGCQQH